MGLHLHTIVESGSGKQITEDFIQTEIALKWQHRLCSLFVSEQLASAPSDRVLQFQGDVQSLRLPPALVLLVWEVFLPAWHSKDQARLGQPCSQREGGLGSSTAAPWAELSYTSEWLSQHLKAAVEAVPSGVPGTAGCRLPLTCALLTQVLPHHGSSSACPCSSTLPSLSCALHSASASPGICRELTVPLLPSAMASGSPAVARNPSCPPSSQDFSSWKLHGAATC